MSFEEMNVDKYIIYDWAVEIRGDEEIQEFVNDPKGFLTKIGALERSPEFNGFMNRDFEDIEAADIKTIYDEKTLAYSTQEGAAVVFDARHLGVPWASRYYCKVLVY